MEGHRHNLWGSDLEIAELNLSKFVSKHSKSAKAAAAAQAPSPPLAVGDTVRLATGPITGQITHPCVVATDSAASLGLSPTQRTRTSVRAVALRRHGLHSVGTVLKIATAADGAAMVTVVSPPVEPAAAALAPPPAAAGGVKLEQGAGGLSGGQVPLSAAGNVADLRPSQPLTAAVKTEPTFGTDRASGGLGALAAAKLEAALALAVALPLWKEVAELAELRVYPAAALRLATEAEVAAAERGTDLVLEDADYDSEDELTGQVSVPVHAMLSAPPAPCAQGIRAGTLPPPQQIAEALWALLKRMRLSHPVRIALEDLRPSPSGGALMGNLRVCLQASALAQGSTKEARCIRDQRLRSDCAGWQLARLLLAAGGRADSSMQREFEQALEMGRPRSAAQLLSLAERPAGQPTAPAPAGLAVALKPYQEVLLAWCLAEEASEGHGRHLAMPLDLPLFPPSSPPHAPSRGGRSSAGLQQGKEPARAAKLDDYQARAPHKAPDVARALLLSVARTSASPSLACAWTDSRCCRACCRACSALL